MANLSNKLTEVTAPAESHMSGISEWGHLPPTYTRTFGQEGDQSLSPLAMLSTTDWPRPTCWVQRDGADAEAGPEGEAGAKDDPGHAGRAHEGVGDPEVRLLLLPRNITLLTCPGHTLVLEALLLCPQSFYLPLPQGNSVVT